MGLILTAPLGDSPSQGNFLGRLAQTLARSETLGAETLSAETLSAETPISTALEGMPLYESVILLPTRRACLKLQEALLEESKAMILPTIAPLGDIEEALSEYMPPHLPAAVDSLERHIALAQFIRKSDLLAYDQPSTIADLALALARFIDLTDRFQADRAKLYHLAPERFAEHWQMILTRLQVIIETWPDYLKQRQRLDPIARRNQILEHFADQLPHFDKPLIIAGSTGSQAATAYLLKAAANYRRGVVILPAIDFALDQNEWDNLPPTHPQYGLKNLLEKMEVERSQIQPWTGGDKHQRRQHLTHAIFHPHAKQDELEAIKAELAHIDFIEANHKREEAAIIALILRHALEERAQTAALITPDRDLARRVRLQLRRWKIEIDDEAGMPLTELPCFIFLKLIADMVVADFTPLAVLCCLKHPLALGGQKAGVLRGRVREIERQMRDDHISANSEYLQHMLQPLEAMLAPLAKLAKRGHIHFATFLKAHIAGAEALAASDQQSGAERLWAHDEGTEKIARHLRLLIEKAEMLGDIPLSDYPQLFAHLFHTAEAAHPHRQIGSRLHIWSPIEARLQHVDLAILGGLNEGVWPEHLSADPWLSRAMRSELGLPPAEIDIGQSAHDFTEALAASHVTLTRATKSADGNPLAASPWVMRIKNIFTAANHELSPSPWQSMLAVLHQSDIEQPDHSAPQPPLEARPKKLSASALTTLINNPYAFYAERILNLKPLAPIEQEPSAAERGSLIHEILHQFIQQHQHRLPENAQSALIAFGKESFKRNAHPIIHHFWWPRFQEMAEKFIALERNLLREGVARIFTEIEGQMVWQIDGHDITLTARADRIDMDQRGNAAIYDYKTGAVPSSSDIKNHRAPQLPLEALILMAGGFADIEAQEISRLAHIKLKERAAAKMLEEIGNHLSNIIQDTETYLNTLLKNYLSPDYSFPAMAEKRISDYHHLARLSMAEQMEEQVEAQGKDGEA